MTDLTNETDGVSIGGSVLNDRLGILPCPFCNSAPKLLNAGIGHVISCENMMCGIRPNTYIEGLFLDGAIRNWNMRPNEQINQPATRVESEKK